MARGIAYAVITALFFALLAIVLKYSMTFASAGTVVFLRFVTAFVTLAAIFAVRRPHELKVLIRPPLAAVAAGVCLAANYFGYMKGLQYTTAANAQVLIQLAPVMLAFTGIFYFREHLNTLQKAGMAVGFAGLLLFYEQQLTRVDLSASEYNTGNLWLVGGAVAWALWGAFQKSLGHRMNPQAVNLVVYGVASLMTTVLFRPIEAVTFTPAVWALMVFLGLSTLAAYATLAQALKLIPVNIVSMIIALNPIGTFLALDVLERLGVGLVQPENITTLGYAGALIFITGVCLVVRYREANPE
ncbi:MAG TPA: DMT family transporter [Bdellovibrionales bacterium]|nr:DMT family transporter [Bdellovibrionales bacterium]